MIYAEKGDLMFTRGATGLGRLIQWGEQAPGEGETWANHVGLVSLSGYILPCAQPMSWEQMEAAVVIESLWKTVEEPWYPKQSNGYEVAIWRYAPLTAWQASVAVTRARQFVGSKYGWWKLATHLLDNKVFGGRLVTRRLLHIDERPICSYTVATAFAMAGVRTGNVPARAQSPDSIWDYVNESDLWYEVGRGVVQKEV